MLQIVKPGMLFLLLLIPMYWLIWMRQQKRTPLRLPFPRLMVLARFSRGASRWQYLYPVLRSIAMLGIVIALAQPQWGRGVRDYRQRGVDIVIAIDISGSMLALDFAPDNRLQAAAKVARNFITRRPNDRFGLVAFSEYALTQSPLTLDHRAIVEQLGRLQVNEKASGTAIGMGLAKAVARLRESKAKSKVIILITDGVNNTGEIDPLSAAEMAASHDIRVYPIGVGSNGVVDFPYDDPLFGPQILKMLIELDMPTLDRIAAMTGTGRAALANDAASFQQIMDTIDNMEKTDFKVQLRYLWDEQFPIFLWLAFLALALELVLRLYFRPVVPEV